MDLSRIGSSWIARLIGASAQHPERVRGAAESGSITRAKDHLDLSAVGRRLTELSEALGDARDRTPAGATVHDREVDGVLRSLAGAVSQSGPGGGDGYVIENISRGLAGFRLRNVDIAPGEEFEVNVEVTQSAQRGGLYLSLGAQALDLGGATSAFVIVVRGPDGTKKLNFTSGQSLGNLITAINQFTDETGVLASAGQTGIAIRSEKYGADEFVLVQIVDDGGLEAKGPTGLYNLRADDEDDADPSTHVAIDSQAAQDGVEDFGQDVAALINGVQAAASGTRISADTPSFGVTIDLLARFPAGKAGPALYNSEFRAFTIVGVEGRIWEDDRATPGFGGVDIRA